MIIIQYFLNQLNTLMLVYLVDIRSFLKLTEIRLDLHISHFCFSLMWESDDTVWNTKQITEALDHVTHIALNCCLIMRQWWQIIIVIDQNLLVNSFTRILIKKIQNIINHVLQTKHSIETKNHYYVLFLNMLIKIIYEFIIIF